MTEHALLSPRERLLAHLTRVVQWTAGGYALFGFIVLATLLAGVLSLNTLESLLLPQFDPTGTPPNGMRLTVFWISCAVVVGVLLWISVGITAQEWGVWLLGVGLLIGGIAFSLTWLTPIFLPMGGSVGYVLFTLWKNRSFMHSNPVTVKELRGRMRGIRAFATITVFLLLMGAFTVLLYVTALSQLSSSRVVESGQLGRMIFAGVVGLELMLIVLIMPSLTAGAITSERERQTYDLLATTTLPVSSFLMGKLSSALGFIGLLVFSAIPLQSIAFLFGGISQTEVLLAVVGLLATALLLGSLGLYLSATTDRTLTATVRVYVLTFAFVFGVPFAMIFLNSTLGKPVFTTLGSYGTYGNAVQGVKTIDNDVRQEIVSTVADLVVSGLNPVLTLIYTQEIFVTHQQTAFFTVRLASNGETLPLPAPWIILVVGYISLSAGLVLVAIRQMKRKEQLEG